MIVYFSVMLRGVYLIPDECLSKKDDFVLVFRYRHKVKKSNLDIVRRIDEWSKRMAGPRSTIEFTSQLRGGP